MKERLMGHMDRPQIRYGSIEPKPTDLMGIMGQPKITTSNPTSSSVPSILHGTDKHGNEQAVRGGGVSLSFGG